MKEEKNVTPITIKTWSNPSIGQESNSNLSKTIDENKKEISELKEEINELREEISRLTGDKVEPIPDIVPTVEEEPKVEIKEEIDIPFDSPFTEAIDTPTEEPSESVKEIVDSVKEEVKEEEKPIEDPVQVPMLDIPLEDEKKEKLSVVVNRYNNDIVASTKGKGAKFILLTDGEQSKLLSGKINEIN